MEDDAAFLFETEAESSLLVDDIYLQLTPLTHSASGPPVASWVMFDAYDDDGREVFGNLYTRQSREEIRAVHDEALAANRPMEISARRSLSLVPETDRYWIVGEIRLAPRLSAPSRKHESHRSLLN